MGIRTIPDDWTGFRVCSNCGVRMEVGYQLGCEYACCDECAIALYDGDEMQLRADLEEEWLNPGSTDCMWTYWYAE
ncbi:MAG: hypothetical protein K2K98_08210 [Muribaculaceae bacterium]|nr:hypothetical protein [Muribaculaceae bacterium]